MHFVRFDYAIENSKGGLISFRPDSGFGTGYRFAIAEGNVNRDLAVAGGVDASGLLAKSTSDFPVDLMWFAGIGAGYADYLTISAPIGIAFGRSFTGRAGWFSPYMSTRAVLEQPFGDSAPPEDGFSVGIAVDIGADFSVGDGRGLVLRVAASLGDRPTLAAGVNVGGR